MATDATGTPTSPDSIPTYNTAVDKPSGNGFNAAMAAIQTALSARAKLASPTFTGTPAAPTPANGDNSTTLATTAFVKNQGYITSNAVSTVFGRSGAVVATSGDYSVGQITGAAPLASPTFTGTPAAPTPATADNSTTLATTAFVKAQGYLTSNAVSTVFGRSGAVVANSGDYTAAQVTNAADKSSGSQQAFTAAIAAAGFVTGIASNTNSTAFNLTPDLAAGNFAVGTCTAGGTNSTINAPVNAPSGSQSALLTIEMRNTGASTSNLVWNAIYNFSNFPKPTAITAGQKLAYVFSYSPSDNVWRCVGQF